MLDFVYNIRTKIHFGRDVLNQLPGEIRNHGSRVLFIYGGGSIRRTGLYDQVCRLLAGNEIYNVELAGVQPNPRLSTVHKGVDLCRQHNLDFVLAVGGGSVIDCAKAIAAGVLYQGDPWDFCLGKEPLAALPVGSILTLAATGSEMNGNSVITNEATLEKFHMGGLALVPVFSLLDPTLTFSVPPWHTAAGVCDIFSHLCENYFTPENDTFVPDRIAEGLFKTCVHYGPIALREPENYEARAAIMWAGSLALNGLTRFGKSGDWATHAMEHALSAVYDVTHGAGLAALTPFWMEYVLREENLWRFLEFARNVWGLDGPDTRETAARGIEAMRRFFKSLGMPSRLSELGAEPRALDDLVCKTMVAPVIGGLVRLNADDVRSIFQHAM